MTTQEIKQLEKLLGKLRGEIGRFAVIDGHLSDGYWIATYDENGDIEKQAGGAWLADCIEKVKPPKKETA